MLLFLKLIIQVVLSPTRGWDDVAVSAGSARSLLRRGLVPLIGVAGLSVFFRAVYQTHPSFGLLFIASVVTCIKYALTYLAGVMAFNMALPRLAIEGYVNSERVEIFTALCVGMMVIVGICENLLPMELSLLQFLPLLIIAVMCYGRIYLDVDERNIFRFAAVGTLSIIVPVYLIDKLLLPAA